MPETNKCTRPNRSTGEPYIYKNIRKLKKERTETYIVRFPKEFGIKSKSFKGAGAYQKAINRRNYYAQKKHILIQYGNFKFDYKPTNLGKGEKGHIAFCGPNPARNFEYHVVTSEGKRVRRILDKSQFNMPSWQIRIGEELGILFTSQMFRRNHPFLLGKKVYVIASYLYKEEYRITYCRPYRDAAVDHEQTHQEEPETIEAIDCKKEHVPQFTPEQRAEIDRIVAASVEKALMEADNRIAPYTATH